MELPKIKSLTTKQMKELRGLGGDIRTAENIHQATEVLIDYIAEKVYPDFDWDEVPYNVATKFACDVYAFTINPAEDTKN